MWGIAAQFRTGTVPVQSDVGVLHELPAHHVENETDSNGYSTYKRVRCWVPGPGKWTSLSVRHGWAWGLQLFRWYKVLTGPD